MNSSTENAPEETRSELQRNLEKLRGLPYFENMPLELLKVVAYLCKRVNYKPGATMFPQDEPSSKAFLILSGQAEVVRNTEGGKHILGHLEEGSFVGGLSLVAEVKRLFSLRAKSKCVCLVLERGDFWPVINQNAEVARRFMETVAQGIVAWEEQLIKSEACRDRLSLVEVGVSLI
jgi:CRP/FNR family cyclic AMP-dependent transcriptional regulator